MNVNHANLVRELLRQYIHKQLTSKNPILCGSCLKNHGLRIRMVPNAPFTREEESQIGFLSPEQDIQWNCPNVGCKEHCHADIGKDHTF